MADELEDDHTRPQPRRKLASGPPPFIERREEVTRTFIVCDDQGNYYVEFTLGYETFRVQVGQVW